MELYRALKFRIYPTKQQTSQIDRTLDCCRFVYNKMLERSTKAYKRRGEHLSGFDMIRLLPSMKEYLPWLADADSSALVATCRQLDKAFGSFFKGDASYPRFKRKRDSCQSYTSASVIAIHYEVGRIKMPKLGWIRHSDNRDFDGKLYHATVTKEHGKYYISVTYKTEKAVERVPIKSCIGLDYKSNGLYVDSDGNFCNMPHFFRVSEQRIAKEQRKLSRKQKHSNNFLKQKKRLQKKERHAANQRKDFLHKKSTEIANRYDLVAVEDLNLNAISQGLRLGKSTLDNGYGKFLDMLDYKLAERGKAFVKVDRFYPSSQTCSCCGYQNPSVKNLAVREWTCPECGVVHDRDINAATNILNEGLRLLSA